MFLGDQSQQDLTNPQSLNSYSYAGNNPTTSSDPSGKSALDSFAGAFNAFATDFSFGVGRVNNSSGNQADYSRGQVVGDAAALVAGSFISAVGFTSATAAATAVPVTGGLSTAAVVGSVGVATYGSFGASQGAYNLATNKNSNDATGNFGVYKIEDENGNTVKYGKADLDRTTQSSGLPTRLHQQLTKLNQQGQAFTGQVVQTLKQVTTRFAKQIENQFIQEHVDTTGSVPPGNSRSFKQ